MLYDFSALINKCELNVIASRINSDFFAAIVKGNTEKEIIAAIEERDKNFVELRKINIVKAKSVLQQVFILSRLMKKISMLFLTTQISHAVRLKTIRTQIL